MSAFGFGRLFFGEHFADQSRVVGRHGPFGHHDDAEALSSPSAVADGLGDALGIVRDFGNEDHVGPAGDARAQGQPAGPMAHDLDHDDPIVAGGRGMEPVDRLGGDAQGRVETEGDVGPRDVVVDGLGQGDDVEPRLLQPQGVLLGAAAADADDGVEMVAARRYRGWPPVMSRISPPISIWCGLSRLVPRMVPPLVRMPESMLLSRGMVRS